MTQASHHTTIFEQEDDGWWIVHCACGWKIIQSVPDADLAADVYGDHRMDMALAGSPVVTARETYPEAHANSFGPSHQGETSRQMQAALDEIDRLRQQVETMRHSIENPNKGEQIQFVDGHWRDVWNDEVDTDPVAFGWLDESWAEVVLRRDFCGCTDVTIISPTVARYLTGGWGRYSDEIIHFDSTDGYQSVIAWLCDARGFTEHGGNIGGSWITPAGKRWLELHRRDHSEVES